MLVALFLSTLLAFNRADPSIEKEYNSYKTLYIRSILESNEKLKIKALKGLIDSSKKLGLDYQDYKIELEDLQKEGIKKSAKIKQHTRTSKNKKRLSVLKSIRFQEKSIWLYFDKPLGKNRINYFSMTDKKHSRYKKIFDIKAIWPYRYRIYKLTTIEKLKIAQYKKNTTRIVLENNRPVKVNFSLKNSILKIYLNKKDKKHTTQKVVKAEKKYIKPIFVKNRKIIVIDPGHGGKDTGAIGYRGLREKNAVLAIAKKLYSELKNRGYRVYLTRYRDYFVTLRNRTKFANRKNADLFISIHANAAPRRRGYLNARGVETYFLSPARSKRAKRVAAIENRADLSSMGYYSKLTFLDFLNRQKIVASNKLAIDVQKGILYNLRKHFRNVIDGGVREAPFWVLVGTQMPSILIETGFITNPTEAKRLFNPYYQKLLAKGIADGVDSYFIHNP